jgi:hypothetical protein
MDEALQVVEDVQLQWSDVIDPDRFGELELATLTVWWLPSNTSFPVRVIPRSAGVDGNVLHVKVGVDQQILRDLREIGGQFLFDVVCDALLDRNGLPVSSSLRALFFGSADFMVPGGLMRLSLTARRG